MRLYPWLRGFPQISQLKLSSVIGDTPRRFILRSSIILSPVERDCRLAPVQQNRVAVAADVLVDPELAAVELLAAGSFEKPDPVTGQEGHDPSDH